MLASYLIEEVLQVEHYTKFLQAQTEDFKICDFLGLLKKAMVSIFDLAFLNFENDENAWETQSARKIHISHGCNLGNSLSNVFNS